MGLYQETKQKLRDGKSKVGKASVRVDLEIRESNLMVKPCFCADLARAQDQAGFTDDLAGYVSGTLLEAGSDTVRIKMSGEFLESLYLPRSIA